MAHVSDFDLDTICRAMSRALHEVWSDFGLQGPPLYFVVVTFPKASVLESSLYRSFGTLAEDATIVALRTCASLIESGEIRQEEVSYTDAKSEVN